MAVEFEISGIIPASPIRVYNAWLSSVKHTAMTGGSATVSDKAGETFTAWDGYIEGRNLKLEHGKRIIQSWRTSEFESRDEDSRLEVLLEAHAEGTLLTIRHSGLPDHGLQYKQGWVDNYFEPMRAFFGE